MARTTQRSNLRAKGPKRKQTEVIWHDDSFRQNPDAPAVQKLNSRLKWQRRAVGVIVFVGVPGMFLTGLAMLSQSNQETPTVDLTESSHVINDPTSKPEAFRALEEWIAGDPSPLPGGRIVSWNGYDTVKPPPPAEGEQEDPDAPKYSYERHTFTVVRGEQTFEATVELAVDDVIGVVSTATPSLTFIPDVPQVVGLGTWFGLAGATPSEEVVSAVQGWATALTSGDGPTLRQEVQDQNAEHAYVPLTGVDELMKVEIVAAAAAPGESAERPEKIVARVALQLFWQGGRPELDDNEQEKLPEPITYDVLIRSADTATPVIVAWGAPGTGPELKAYQNALTTELRITNEDAPPIVEETTIPGEDASADNAEGAQN